MSLGEEDGVASGRCASRPGEAHANDAGRDADREQWARSGGGPDQRIWVDLRASGAELDALGAGLFTTAVALRNWHDRPPFCTRDGSPMNAIQFGWAQQCEAKGTRSTRAPTRR